MEKAKKQLVVFGYGLAVILGIISLHIWRHHGWQIAHVLLFSCMVALTGITAVRYTLLEPVYRPWMKVAHLIGSVITGIVLSILFYLVFGIAGIILRLMKKDLLDQEIDPARDSYWIKREQVAFNKESYSKQF